MQACQCGELAWPWPRLTPAVPEDYIEYFREHNVTAVVRLNKKMYEVRGGGGGVSRVGVADTVHGMP